jgi:hypothetical protein
MKTRTLIIAALTACAMQTVNAQESATETAALRCSAVSLLHSSLTVPSPQFGEFMVQIAGLFAEIYTTQNGLRTKSRPTVADLKAKRDAMVAELRKGWPANKDKLIREAASCNLWRLEFFSKLSEKPTDKELNAAFAQTAPPTAQPNKATLGEWTRLTTEAMGASAAMRVQPGKK